MDRVLSIVSTASKERQALWGRKCEEHNFERESIDVNDFDFEAYEEAMERELQGSAMVHTFERAPPSTNNALERDRHRQKLSAESY